MVIGIQDRKELVHILEITRKAPVLTVEHTEDFLELGGVIRLIQKDNKMHVAINLEAGRRARLVGEYEDALVNPYEAAERGFVDAVIAPSETRVQIVRALRALRNKRAALPAKKHGNVPL